MEVLLRRVRSAEQLRPRFRYMNVAPCCACSCCTSVDSETEERCLVTIPEQHGRPAQTPYIGVDSDDRCADNELWVSVEGSPYQVRKRIERGMLAQTLKPIFTNPGRQEFLLVGTVGGL